MPGKATALDSLPCNDPAVTFIVPCYNLGHLLAECIDSILAQSLGDFEILIMDDCSPDNTQEVAQSYRDSRVIHHRNERNLRHLANYNRGIHLARGRYVWLISADDRLRSRQILEKYLGIMESHPEVGYVFCPAVGLEDDRETVVHEYSYHGSEDVIFPGVSFLEKLLDLNSVVAASGMVRRECYERLGSFPLDMPYAGDWYLWCLFALHYDVAYCAEPMVNYRQHPGAITNQLKKKSMGILFDDDRSVLTRIRDQAHRRGERSIVTRCSERLIELYLPRILSEESATDAHLTELESLLNDNSLSLGEQNLLVARLFTRLADSRYSDGDLTEARKYYLHAMGKQPWLLRTWLKYGFLVFGKGGMALRSALSSVKGLVYRS